MSLGSQLKRIEARLPPKRDGPLILHIMCDERQEVEVRRQIVEAGYGPEDIRVTNLTALPDSGRSMPALPYVLYSGPGERPRGDATRQAVDRFKSQINQMVERTRTHQYAMAIVLSPEDADL